MNIIILDDHPVIRFSLNNIIKEVFPNATVFESSNLSEFYNILKNNLPISIIFLDIFLQNNESGLAALKQIKNEYPDAIIIVFSFLDTPEVHWILKKYQVHAFFSKSTDLSIIKDYLNNLEQHKTNFFTSMPQKTSVSANQIEYIEYFLTNLKSLTPLEFNILKLKINQYKNSDIAQILKIKQKTVENYINRISEKIVHNELKFNDFINKYHELLQIIITTI